MHVRNKWDSDNYSDSDRVSANIFRSALTGCYKVPFVFYLLRVNECYMFRYYVLYVSLSFF